MAKLPAKPADNSKLKPKQIKTHPYSQTDPLPVPEAIETDSDTIWSLWQELAGVKKPYEDTVLAPFPDTEISELTLVPEPKIDTTLGFPNFNLEKLKKK